MKIKINAHSARGQVPCAVAKSIFLSRCRALNLSSETISWYEKILNELCETMSVDISEIKSTHIISHLEAIKSRHCPSTIARYYIGLKTFFKVMIEQELINKNPLDTIPRPKRPRTLIEPLNKNQMEAFIKTFKSKSFVGVRNRAMIALFLDSGPRVSEIVNLYSVNIDWSGQQLKVIGKGEKERFLQFGNSCRQALWKYWIIRQQFPGDLFFINHFGLKLNRHRIAAVVSRAGKKIGVKVTPHVLRHTFATEYIRNGGDPVSLKVMLGHENLETVMIYVKLASQDISMKHRKFSPLDNVAVMRTRLRFGV